MVQLHQNLVTALKQIGGNDFRYSCYGPCVNFAPRVKLARVLIKILVTQKSTFTLVHVFKIDLKAKRKASAKVGKEIQILRIKPSGKRQQAQLRRRGVHGQGAAQIGGPGDGATRNAREKALNDEKDRQFACKSQFISAVAAVHNREMLTLLPAPTGEGVPFEW